MAEAPDTTCWQSEIVQSGESTQQGTIKKVASNFERISLFLELLSFVLIIPLGSISCLQAEH